jgi:hypothetical protein
LKQKELKNQIKVKKQVLSSQETSYVNVVTVFVVLAKIQKATVIKLLNYSMITFM